MIHPCSHEAGGWLRRAWMWWGTVVYSGMWIWRPLCWLAGHEDDSYGDCVFCQKPMRGRGAGR